MAAIGQLREQRGWTVEQLVYRSGLTAGAVTRIELAQSNPSWATVRKVAAGLGVTLAELGKRVERG